MIMVHDSLVGVICTLQTGHRGLRGWADRSFCEEVAELGLQLQVRLMPRSTSALSPLPRVPGAASCPLPLGSLPLIPQASARTPSPWKAI